MNIVLKNAAGRTTEHFFRTNEEAHGAIGSFWPVIKNNVRGHFEFVSPMSTAVKFVPTN